MVGFAYLVALIWLAAGGVEMLFGDTLEAIGLCGVGALFLVVGNTERRK